MPSFTEHIATIATSRKALLETARAFLALIEKDTEKSELSKDGIAASLNEVSAAFSDYQDACDDFTYPQVTISTVVYAIKSAVLSYNGTEYTAEDIQDDNALATEMLAAGCDHLIPIVVANFTADDTTVGEGGDVTFTDSSTNDPDTWFWDFGDGNESDEQSPVHSYADAGTYTVRLTARNKYGETTKTRTDYITVS